MTVKHGMADQSVIIALDGPAGAGKTSTAREVAKRLNFSYLDTGAMYRAVALQALLMGSDLENPVEVTKAVNAADIRIKFIDGKQYTLLNGKDVSTEIRTPAVTQAVSPVCEVPYVREKMVALQRKIGQSGRFVVEGRDIGTVVFPDADLKIFMTADMKERALRRKADFERAGIPEDYENLTAALVERDRRDSTRDHSPLKAAEDAIIIDTTNLTFEEQVDLIIGHFKDKIAKTTNKIRT